MPHGAVLTFQDVTERRRVDEVRRDFVANASHELRTPLTSIRGFVEALEDGGLEEPPTARRFLEKIRTHADRMAALVSDLLELSRLESGERPPAWDGVAPEEAVDEVVTALAALAKARQIEISTSVEAPPFETDRDRLRGVLENLVENALKYTPAGGHVSVSARSEGRRRRVRGDRRRTRHRGAAPPAGVRALLPGGQGAQPRARGHRPRPVDRQAPRGEPGRQRVGDQRARPRQPVHRPPARLTPGGVREVRVSVPPRAEDALEFVRREGIVLQSAHGRAASLAERVAGERIRGSWWGHPKGHEIFAAAEHVIDSGEVLVCRLVDGKVTYVHRRLWPALVRLAARVPHGGLDQVSQEHTPSGRHVRHVIPFPKWVPPDVDAAAARLSEEEARRELAPWSWLYAGEPAARGRAKRKTTRRRG